MADIKIPIRAEGYWMSSGTATTATYTTITVSNADAGTSGGLFEAWIKAEEAAIVATSSMSLSVNPSSFILQFSADPNNAQVQVVISNGRNTAPYQQFYTAEVADGQSLLVIPRHDRLPKGTYEVQASIMQWIDNQLVAMASSQIVIIEVP